ncbi:hypothetical protein [Actinomadura sp. 7K507]|uniref:hypothetical protein n=1 Tax=Actinomadura sp. 7K507 TaxID=2530365 RepID=UPI0014045229|nr:hypothetical protein [Actinomadura sp. 7K507]
MLSLGLSVSSATMRPGGSITATVRVSSARATAHGTVLRVSASGASVSPGTQRLGSVGGGGASAVATVRAPSDAKAGVITVRASVSAAKARGASRSYKLIVTDAAGALPPGVSLANLPPGVPPLTPDDFNPLGGMKGPQVALPPIASPQIAASPAPLVPVAGLSTVEEEMFTVEGLSSLQAGFLAAMGVSVMLLLLRLKLARRAYVPLPRALRRRLRLKAKRVTAARLRALPPQPAPVRPAIRLVWLPVRPARVARL